MIPAGAGPLTVAGVSYTVGGTAGGRTLLHDIDVEFPAGQVTALSGPSGSGKTTLLSVAGGLLEPTTGTTAYAGAPMWRGTGDPRREVAFVLQVYGLVPILSARENVSVALRARGVAPADADERAEAALARFHIADLGDRQVEELSGGQMQRVALARGCVVLGPAGPSPAPLAGVLLADEPTSELDEGNRGLVLRELRAEAARGVVVVVATHDPAVVEACDRHLVIDEGRITDHVTPVRHSVPDSPLTRPNSSGGSASVGDTAAPLASLAPLDRHPAPDSPLTRPNSSGGSASGGAELTGDEGGDGGEDDRDSAFRRPRSS